MLESEVCSFKNNLTLKILHLVKQIHYRCNPHHSSCVLSSLMQSLHTQLLSLHLCILCPFHLCIFSPYLSALVSSSTPRYTLGEGRWELQPPSLQKQAGGCCIWRDEVWLCHFSSEKPILAHGRMAHGKAVSFSKKKQKRKQEDLFPSKWRNIDIAPGMKWIAGDSSQLKISTPTLGNPVLLILVDCPHSLVKRLFS